MLEEPAAPPALPTKHAPRSVEARECLMAADGVLKKIQMLPTMLAGAQDETVRLVRDELVGFHRRLREIMNGQRKDEEADWVRARGESFLMSLGRGAIEGATVPGSMQMRPPIPQHPNSPVDGGGG